VYQRILSLFCRSPSFVASSSTYLPSRGKSTPNAIISLIQTLSAQLSSLPKDAFETELPELDTFFIEEFGNLRRSIGPALRTKEGSWSKQHVTHVVAAWKDLVSACKQHGWQVESLVGPTETEAHASEDPEVISDEEDGEYAPVIVDISE
jgi:hypothetical protein